MDFGDQARVPGKVPKQISPTNILNSKEEVAAQFVEEHGACNGLLVDIRCVRMYASLPIISCTLVHPHDRMTLYAYVLYIPAHRHASHHTYMSYAKHDDDRPMSLSILLKKSGS